MTEGDGHVVLHVEGQLDVSSRAKLREAMDGLSGPDRDLVIDCERVDFLDSTALTVLLRSRTAQRSAGRDLVLRHPSTPVWAVLHMAGLTEFFTVEGGPEAERT